MLIALPSLLLRLWQMIFKWNSTSYVPRGFLDLLFRIHEGQKGVKQITTDTYMPHCVYLKRVYYSQSNQLWLNKTVAVVDSGPKIHTRISRAFKWTPTWYYKPVLGWSERLDPRSGSRSNFLQIRSEKKAQSARSKHLDPDVDPISLDRIAIQWKRIGPHHCNEPSVYIFPFVKITT